MKGPSHPVLLPMVKDHQIFFDFFCSERHRMGDTLLNVGLGPYAGIDGSVWIDWFMKELDVPFKKVYVIEYDKSQANYFIKYYEGNENVVVFHGDVRKASQYLKEVDTVFWWHGPEHIPQADLKQAFDELNAITKKSMFWSCPWGKYYQLGLEPGQYDGSQHYFYPENEMFTSLGMNVFNDNVKDSGSANINAYLFKDNI